MTLKALAVGLGLAALTGAGAARADGPAAPAPADGPSVGEPRSYPYRDAATYAVLATPGRITDIVLEPGERLVGTGPIAAGDTARWVIGDTTSGEGTAQRVHVLVKPTLPGLATNLIINTNRRTYHLELRSAARDWWSQIAWRYPEPPLVAPPQTLPVAAVVPPDPDLAHLNFAYRIKGPKVSWRPMRVFDDGRRTYVEFAPTIAMAELPPLFGVGPNGRSSELVNYRVAGRRIIVDRILDRAELRMGQGRGERRVRLIREPGR